MAHNENEWSDDSDPNMLENANEYDPQDEREQLRALREVHFEALERFLAEVDNDEAFFDFTAAELGVRRERMQRHFNSMESAHLLYRQCTIMASNDVYVNMEARIMQAFAKLDTRISYLNGIERDRAGQNANMQAEHEAEPLNFANFNQPRVTANSTMNATGHQVIRVETARRPQLGKFNGSPADWPAFRDLFIAEVHNREYDPVTKLLYLRDACIGKAAATLGPWQPTAGNYQLAWETMLAAYDDEYHVVHGILGKMHATERHEFESHSTLRSVLDTLNGGTRQLLAISTQPILWDQMWIHFAKQRLPRRTLDAWEQYRNQQRLGSMPTLDEFKQFLDSKSKARREFENEETIVPRATNERGKRESRDGRQKRGPINNRFKPYKKAAPERSSSNRESHGYGPPKACVMTGCTQVHYLGQCQEFAKLSYADKMEVVKQHHLCRCCLMAGHMATICKRYGCSKCPDSKFKHHFRLCQKATNVRAITFTSSVPSQPAPV